MVRGAASEWWKTNSPLGRLLDLGLSPRCFSREPANATCRSETNTTERQVALPRYHTTDPSPQEAVQDQERLQKAGAQMGGFTRAFTAASAVPAAAVAAYALSSSSRLRFLLPTSLPSLSSAFAAASSARAPNAVPPMAAAAAAATDLSAPDKDATLPELTTEFMVDMKCEGCVAAVKNKLQTIEGIKNIEVDLNNQVVRVLGSLPVKTMLDALHETGRVARLIGQGNPNDFLISAAVAEFKGPVIYGVVRLAQVNMELARVEATFSGLSPGKHGWSINEFGDLTRGAESTGKVYNPPDYLSKKPLGDLGTLEAGENGEAHFSGSKEKMKVVDLIGRSIALYATEDRSDSGIAAAVIARSAGVGENYKKLCTCDGVTIWESS